MQRIWIDVGCIHCFWCQNLNDRVFVVTDDGCQIRSDAREDELQSDNRTEHSPLRAGVLDASDAAFMPFLAGGCPSQVIKLEGFAHADNPLEAFEV
jgi:ferredoxin